MIPQKSFQYAELLSIKKNVLLLSVLKSVVFLIIFVETVLHLFYSFINRKNNNNIYFPLISFVFVK